MTEEGDEMKPEYKVSMEEILNVKLHHIRIVFHNYLRYFLLQVKKDLTVVQGKYAPNPQQDQLAVLKVTFVTIFLTLSIEAILAPIDFSTVMKGSPNYFVYLVGLLTFSLFFIWGNTI